MRSKSTTSSKLVRDFLASVRPEVGQLEPPSLQSCFSGKFRESCGVDAYDGVDVTPIKIKKLGRKTRRLATKRHGLP
jgi:hypothetical protein